MERKSCNVREVLGYRSGFSAALLGVAQALIERPIHVTPTVSPMMPPHAHTGSCEQMSCLTVVRAKGSSELECAGLGAYRVFILLRLSDLTVGAAYSPTCKRGAE